LLHSAEDGLRRNDIPAAQALLEEGLKANPDWKAGLWLSALLHYRSAQYVPARLKLERLTRLDARAGAPWTLLGLCEFEMQDFGLASAHLEVGRALGMPPQLELEPVARFQEAVLLIMNRRYELALFLLGQLAGSHEAADESLSVAIGLAALNLPISPRDAAALLEPDQLDQVLRVGRAGHLEARRQPAQADAANEALFHDYTTAAGLHGFYGFQLRERGDFEKAALEYEQEVRLSPANFRAWLGLAACRLQLADFEAALSAARRAVALEPRSFVGQLHVGRALLGLERPSEALAPLLEARRLNPASSPVRFALTTAYRQTGEEALAATEQKEFERLKKVEDARRLTSALPADFFEGSLPKGALRP
jgi:tetratricopeptide (TPR) repeat protein